MCLDLNEKLFQVWIELWEQFYADERPGQHIICVSVVNEKRNQCQRAFLWPCDIMLQMYLRVLILCFCIG